jgi:hypothetical protein
VDRTRLWLLRGGWFALPFTVGVAVAHADAGASGAVRTVIALGLWALWTAGLLASLVPSTVGLTALRLIAPGAPLAAVIALVARPDLTTMVGAMAGALVAVFAFRGRIGRTFVQGSAYGDEARFPLRPPGPLLLGPLPLLWLALAGAVAGGPLLLAARSWIAGALLSAVAVALVLVLPRRFHRLAQRFVVFVPAGFVLHDAMALADTAMFRWTKVRGIDRALARTQALDLTAGALGPAMEVALAGMETIVRTGSRPGRTSAAHAAAFLCSPTLVADAVAEAHRRQPGRARQAAMPPPST